MTPIKYARKGNYRAAELSSCVTSSRGQVTTRLSLLCVSKPHPVSCQRSGFLMEVTKVSSVILTPKQHKFCLKYVESGNASLAYREVYNSSGSKPSTVSRKAKELLDNGYD